MLIITKNKAFSKNSKAFVMSFLNKRNSFNF